MGFAHESCMGEWIRRRQSNQCELCMATTKFDPPELTTEEVDLELYLNQHLAHMEVARTVGLCCRYNAHEISIPASLYVQEMEII